MIDVDLLMVNAVMLQGYNARENERARRMRTFVGRCEACNEPISEDPGHCTLCAWTGDKERV